MDNGEEIYEKFLAGDKQGLQELVELYRDGLILYINNYIGDIVFSEDLAEDVFVELVVKKPHFNGKSQFKTWLYSIARHKALNWIKRNQRYVYISGEEMDAISDNQADFERQYLKDEQKILLHHAMENLNDDYRQVLYLSYFEGFSNSEIAVVMSKSKRQIENLIYRAKLSLRNILVKENFIYEDL